MAAPNDTMNKAFVRERKRHQNDSTRNVPPKPTNKALENESAAVSTAVRLKRSTMAEMPLRNGDGHWRDITALRNGGRG